MRKVVFVFAFLVFTTPAFCDLKRICLTMVVKNDERVVEKCLKSAQGIVDCICICDVGSTDATLDIVEEFLEDSEIPGAVYRHDWRGVGYNKTFAAAAAQQMIKDLGFSLQETYLLALDADTTLASLPSFDKQALRDPAYRMLEKSSVCCKYETRLFLAKFPWECRGAVRDHWSCSALEGEQFPELRGLAIEESGDPQHRADKLKKDVEQISQALKADPGNEKYLFYLAQAYRGLKQHEDAIFWSKARIDKGGSKEEVWFSKYMIGESYEEMGRWENALYWYLEAFQGFPVRSEPLLKVASHYRYRGENDLAYIFAKHASRIPIPEERNLFASPLVFDYWFDEELSIAAYYTRFRDEGYSAASDLVLRKNVSGQLREQTYRNLMFYVENLKQARFMPVRPVLPPIREGDPALYNPMNPSVMKTEDGYVVICRSVNYTQVGAKVFNTIDPTGVFKTRNFLLRYDRAFNLLGQSEIIENLEREKVRSWNLTGLEDCRVFSLNGDICFTCTTVDTHPTGEKQISLCRLEEAERGSKRYVKSLVPFWGPDPYRCEKNWLPFVDQGCLRVVYSYDPFVIYEPDLQTGACKMVLRYEPEHDFSRFRGSAAPMEFDGGYLIVVHEVAWKPDYERCYFHRFLWLDKDWVICKASRPFTYTHLGVEYCCGMTTAHETEEIVMSIGVEDREAYLCFISPEEVRAMLRPLPDTRGGLR